MLEWYRLRLEGTRARLPVTVHGSKEVARARGRLHAAEVRAVAERKRNATPRGGGGEKKKRDAPPRAKGKVARAAGRGRSETPPTKHETTQNGFPGAADPLAPGPKDIEGPGKFMKGTLTHSAAP